MLLSTTLYQISKLSLTTETKIVFNENVEFFVGVQNYDELNFSLHVTNVKGTTLKTVEIAQLGQSYGLPYDENKDCFLIGKEEFHQTSFKFYVKADFEYKVVKFAEQPQCIKVMCNIKVSALRLQFLNVHECYADLVMIDGYENVKLKCFIKKTKPNFIDLTIERAYGCIINGQNDEYTYLGYDDTDIDVTVTFEFISNILKETNEILQAEKKDLVNSDNDGGVIYVGYVLPHVMFKEDTNNIPLHVETAASLPQKNIKQRGFSFFNRIFSGFNLEWITNQKSCLNKKCNITEAPISDGHDNDQFAFVKYFNNGANVVESQ